ncbi:porin family protein [Myroides indicus]|uniref:Outer membrane protein with beta-barrel domain n=1 Tax=Myroides indicus TaxID=1323422 RepID=A0A4R7F5S4_9FLAO|nr:porin family protein [Myroides indicus]TDS65042.1 outer membrane protein with beta-barrel domain [Myroides indicus]
MKKIILSALALTAFTFTANAQTPDLKLGAKAGVNFANLNGGESMDMKTGFHVGVLAEIFINEKFSVQPEILYSSQGAEKDGLKANFDYINVPIIGKYYVMDGLNVQFGPQIGFLTKAELKGGGEKMDMKDASQKVDFGVNFGAGYELPMGVFFDARYNLGFTKVEKEGENSSKNGVIQISVGYKF